VRLYGGDAVSRAVEVGAARPVSTWRVAQVRRSASVTHRSQRRDARIGVACVPRRARTVTYGSDRRGTPGDVEDHVWFEDRWMVASLCDE
jgi:hypothetical protein